MATNRTSAAGVLARVLQDAPADGRTDGELLTTFLDGRDASAFAELVQRHGPMVLGVCRRVLGHVHDAEDAFQATFLVLARKANTVSPRNALANWLYGVAHLTAVRARAVSMKRRMREANVPTVPEAIAPPPADDVAAVLDEELARLPDHYRAVVVLCDVEGRTRADAAAHLGCPEGSVNSRLSRARAMLARRLSARGVTLSAGAFAAVAVSPNLVTATVEAALAGVVVPAVATLTDGVIKAMFVTKLKTITAVVLAVGLLGVGGFTGYRAAIGEEPIPAKAGGKKDEEPPITELRFTVRNGTTRPDGTNLYVFTDDDRKAFVPEPATRTLKPMADAIAMLTTNGSNILRDDRALLIEQIATGIRVGAPDFSKGTPLKEFYCVAIYPRAGLLPKPAAPEKEHAAFDPGKVATLADAMKTFGIPTHREKIAANKWVQANGLGIEGEIRWWGEYGIRADATGGITHVLLRNPFGNSTKVSAADERKKLQGRWRQVAVTVDGAESEAKKLHGVHLLFNGERTWNEIGGNQKAPPEPFALDPDKNPKWIDMQCEIQGKVRKSFNIYSLDENKLTICLSDVENAPEDLRPKAFTAAAGTKQMLLVYERIPEFKAVGTLGAVRADDTAIPGIFDDTRPPYAAKPGKHPTEAQALKLLAANEKTILTDDRELLKKYYATSILATPGQRRTFDQLYVVVIYPNAVQPKLVFVPQTSTPGKGCATFQSGQVKTRNDALAEFGDPTDWEMLSEKWVVGHTHGAEGEILWWGEYGIRADAKGGITHILLRNPFGKPAEKKPVLADVVKAWTPALAGAKVEEQGTTLIPGRTRNSKPGVASYVFQVTGASFEALWNDYAKKCGSDHRYAENTYHHDSKVGDPGRLIQDVQRRPDGAGRLSTFTYSPSGPGYTVAVTLQPKGDGTTTLCTLVVVMDE